MDSPAPNTGVADRWYATNGALAIGPVSFTLLVRGLANGRLSTCSHVRHESWRVWRRAGELSELTSAARRTLAKRLGAVSDGARNGDSSTHRGSGEFLLEEERPPLSQTRPRAIDPVGVLASAEGLDSALMLTLALAVTAGRADSGLVHRCGETGRVVTVAALGQNADSLLGTKVSPRDPAVLAAREARTLLPGAEPGSAGAAIKSRLELSLGRCTSVAMVPVVARGELVSTIELARSTGVFRARDLGRVEETVDAFVARAVVEGWVR